MKIGRKTVIFNFRWEILSTQNGIKSLVAYTLKDGLLSPVGRNKWKLEVDCSGNNWTAIHFKFSQVQFTETHVMLLLSQKMVGFSLVDEQKNIIVFFHYILQRDFYLLINRKLFYLIS